MSCHTPSPVTHTRARAPCSPGCIHIPMAARQAFAIVRNSWWARGLTPRAASLCTSAALSRWSRTGTSASARASIALGSLRAHRRSSPGMRSASRRWYSLRSCEKTLWFIGRGAASAGRTAHGHACRNLLSTLVATCSKVWTPVHSRMATSAVRQAVRCSALAASEASQSYVLRRNTVVSDSSSSCERGEGGNQLSRVSTAAAGGAAAAAGCRAASGAAAAAGWRAAS
eukprot:2457590-Prymnesium_polylepis.1